MERTRTLPYPCHEPVDWPGRDGTTDETAGSNPLSDGSWMRGKFASRKWFRVSGPRLFDSRRLHQFSRLIQAAVLLLASVARAEDPSFVVRPLVGVGVSGSDSGLGVAAQLGVRLSSLLLRGTLDLGGSTGRRGYIAGTLRGDWLYPITETTALIAGIGIGGLSYGFIFDDPTAHLAVLTPEIGALLPTPSPSRRPSGRRGGQGTDCDSSGLAACIDVAMRPRVQALRNVGTRRDQLG